MGCHISRRVLVVVLAGLILFPAALRAQKESPPATSDQPASHKEPGKFRARTVRVFFANGKVLIKRSGSAGDESVLRNTPIQEGFKLTSQSHSFAVVDLENSSTAIMGENSRLLFHELALDDNGNRLTGITMERGFATFHVRPEHHSPSPVNHRRDVPTNGPVTNSDLFQLKISGATVTASARCRFRADLSAGYWGVKVFHGTVTVGAMTSDLRKGEFVVQAVGPTLTRLNVQKGIKKDPWDRWVEKQESQVLRADKEVTKGSRTGIAPSFDSALPGQGVWGGSHPW